MGNKESTLPGLMAKMAICQTFLLYSTLGSDYAKLAHICMYSGINATYEFCQDGY